MCIRDRFSTIGGDPELLRPLVGVRPEYLESALGEMRRLFGPVERYFAVGLGLGDETQLALREAFIERD